MAGIWRCSKPDDFSFKNVNFKRLFIIVLAGQALSLLITGKLLLLFSYCLESFQFETFEIFLNCAMPCSFFFIQISFKNHEKPFIYYISQLNNTKYYNFT